MNLPTHPKHEKEELNPNKKLAYHIKLKHTRIDRDKETIKDKRSDSSLT